VPSFELDRAVALDLVAQSLPSSLSQVVNSVSTPADHNPVRMLAMQIPKETFNSLEVCALSRADDGELLTHRASA
jgi:hypothetical protein